MLEGEAMNRACFFPGQAIFAAGGFMDSFVLMQAGRFVFGLGGETLQVVQNSYVSKWFAGSFLNTVFGLQLSVARFGATANFQV